MHFIWLLAVFFFSSAHAFESRTFRQISFDVQSINLKTHDVRQYWKNPEGKAYARLADLRKTLRTQKKPPILLVNSGIYDTSYRPLGLYIENGQRFRKLNESKGSGGNFGLRPNGVFFISRANDGASAAVVETSKFKMSDAITEATQSGPLLVIDDKLHPAFSKGSENKKIRNGVGVSRAGHVVFAISQAPVSFYDFADFFRTELDCPNALYLDGTISMMIDDRTPDSAAETQLVPFVGMWAAWPKTK